MRALIQSFHAKVFRIIEFKTLTNYISSLLSMVLKSASLVPFIQFDQPQDMLEVLSLL